MATIETAMAKLHVTIPLATLMIRAMTSQRTSTVRDPMNPDAVTDWEQLRPGPRRLPRPWIIWVQRPWGRLDRPTTVVPSRVDTLRPSSTRRCTKVHARNTQRQNWLRALLAVEDQPARRVDGLPPIGRHTVRRESFPRPARYGLERVLHPSCQRSRGTQAFEVGDAASLVCERSSDPLLLPLQKLIHGLQGGRFGDLVLSG